MLLKDQTQIPFGNDNDRDIVTSGMTEYQMQILFGNDNEKTRRTTKVRRRFPSGMTTRRAQANTKAKVEAA
jgi:hypothetical protein